MTISPDPPPSTRPTLSWTRSRADLVRLIRERRLPEILGHLPPPTLRNLSESFFIRTGKHQVPPDEDAPWHTWLILGGRGAGKTRAGAEWVNGMVGGLPGISRVRA